MPTEFADLVAGYSVESLSEFLQVTPRIFTNWKTGRTQPPHSAVIALRLKIEGDLSTIGGNAWNGFYLRRGEFTAPLHGRPFNPYQLQGMFFEVQLARHYKREIETLKTELQDMRARLWAHEKIRTLTSVRADVPR
jgi:hypothetical protein